MIESDAECQPVNLIFEWQDIGLETDFLHPLLIKDE